MKHWSLKQLGGILTKRKTQKFHLMRKKPKKGSKNDGASNMLQNPILLSWHRPVVTTVCGGGARATMMALDGNGGPWWTPPNKATTLYKKRKPIRIVDATGQVRDYNYPIVDLYTLRFVQCIVLAFTLTLVISSCSIPYSYSKSSVPNAPNHSLKVVPGQEFPKLLADSQSGQLAKSSTLLLLPFSGMHVRSDQAP